MKQCLDCRETKPLTAFYKSKTHAQGVMVYCRKCFNARCQQRWVNRKVAAIEHKGSCCTDCGLQLKDSHYAVFEFHHLEPEKKDLDWNKLRLGSWSRILEELAKCVLLCANCHRIRHATM